MKSIIAAVILIFPSSAFAQVVSVNVYPPVPGGAQLTAEYFQEAKAILQAGGAQVITSSDLKGTFRFATLFDNWEAYGRFAQSLPTNESWGFYPARADTSEKAHLGPGGVSWQSEGSTARSLNVRRSG